MFRLLDMSMVPSIEKPRFSLLGKRTVGNLGLLRFGFPHKFLPSTEDIKKDVSLEARGNGPLTWLPDKWP